MYKCAIIWTGNIAWWYDNNDSSTVYTHAWALNKFDEFSFWAVYDPINNNAEVFAKKWNADRHFNDYWKFLNEINNYDIISICSPTEYHFEHLKSLLKTNVKIIICEKPPVSNLDELNKIINLNKGYKKTITVNIIRHFDNTFPNIINYYKDSLWEIKYIKWYYEKWLMHNWIHFIDLMKHFLNLEFDNAKTISIHNKLKQDIMWDIRFTKNGIYFDLINLYWVRYTIFEAEFFFEKWKIEMLEDGKYLKIYQAYESQKFEWYYYLDKEPIVIKTNLDNCMINLYNNCINHIETWEKLTVRLEDTLKYYLLFNQILWN